MNYRRLGSAGLKISELSLGAWVTYGGQVGEDVALKCMSAAHDAGVNFFDNAEAYAQGNAEVVMGNVIKKMGWRRESLVISSKVFWGGEGPNDLGLSHKHIYEACRNSLRRLQLDYLDLFFCHRPDPNTPIEETLRALDDLVRAGKVRHIGCSNFSVAQIEQAQHVAQATGLTRFVATEDQYSLLSREIERDLLPAIQEHKLALLPYFPLASGLLTGKYRLGQPLPTDTRLSNPRYSDRVLNDDNLRIIEQLEQFCAARGRTLLQLAFGWLLAKPVVAGVIAGASTPDQVTQNAGATGWEMNANEIAEVDRITRR